jgi:2-dehydro-3-deoxygluconokinase
VVDVALPTFEDEAALFGDADPEATARRWRDFGALEVAVKRGADGALIDAADFRGWVRPLREVRPVDTTGAGDSFNGAYIGARVVDGAAAAAAAAHRLAAAVISRRGAIIPHDAMPLAEAAAC